MCCIDNHLRFKFAISLWLCNFGEEILYGIWWFVADIHAKKCSCKLFWNNRPDVWPWLTSCSLLHKHLHWKEEHGLSDPLFQPSKTFASLNNCYSNLLCHLSVNWKKYFLLIKPLKLNSIKCTLWHLLQNLPALILKIMRGTFAPISDRYSNELRQLILSMLHLDPNKRPNINEIMAQPIILSALMHLYTDFGSVPCRRYLPLFLINYSNILFLKGK